MTLPSFPAEWRQVTDSATGALVLQWTSAPAMHHHFYFTNPSVSGDGRWGYLVSYRSGYPNLLRMDLGDGRLTQLTDRVDINPFSPTLSRRGPWVYFSARDAVFEVNVEDGSERLLCRFDTPRLGNCSLSYDGRELAIGLRYDDGGALALVDVVGGQVRIVHRGPEVGHIQFCPRDGHLLLFSGSIRQRIWVLERRSGAARCVYAQAPGQWLVHETWSGRGDEIFFPHWPHALCAIRPDGSGLRTIAAINAWHACSHPSGMQIVCDSNHPDRGLLLIDSVSGQWRTLCAPGASCRGTQWQYDRPAEGPGIDVSIIRSSQPEQDPPPKPDDPASTYGPQWSHPHPSFSDDGQRVIYTSDRDGFSQVYSVAVPGWYC